MAETITLVTRESIFHLDGGPLHAEHIVGITMPSMATIMEYGAAVTGGEQEAELCLSGVMHDRLLDFYDRCRVRSPARGFYNCHLFVSHMLGLTAIFNEWAQYHWSDQEPNRPDDIQAGQPYGIMKPHGHITHSLLGTNYADANLSVLGIRQPLVLSDNRQLRDGYIGRFVHLIA